MQTEQDRTIADLVRESPLRANVFERYQIDYCCNGGRPLQEVCAKQGLDAESILAELHAQPRKEKPVDYDEMTLSALCSHIVTRHHAYLRSTLPSVIGKARKVAAAHGSAHRFLPELERLVGLLAAELTQHMGKEEIVLFPLIERMERASQSGGPAPHAPGGTVRNPIQAMEHEHDDAGRVLRRVRELTSDYQPPANACNTFQALYAQLEELERDLHMHIHLENNLLFPRAAELERRLGMPDR